MTSIAKDRADIVQRYARAEEHGLLRNSAAWCSGRRSEIEVAGLNPFAQAASLTFLAEYERVPECIEAIGTLNRWSLVPALARRTARRLISGVKALCVAALSHSPNKHLSSTEYQLLPTGGRR